MIKSKKYIEQHIALAIMLAAAATASYAQPETPQAACERLRLQCQKDWAETNSSGVPVTSPEKTKLCWDIYNRCMGAASANQSTTPAEKPDHKTKPTSSAIKHFEVRSGNEYPVIDDCVVNGTDVKCTGRYEHLPSGYGSYVSTTIGKISGSVITGTTTAITEMPAVGNGCSSHVENSWPVTMTLSANNEATLEVGTVKFRQDVRGTGACPRVDTGTSPGSTQKATWKNIE